MAAAEDVNMSTHGPAPDKEAGLPPATAGGSPEALPETELRAPAQESAGEKGQLVSKKPAKVPPEPGFNTDFEREILRVLWAHRERPLVRSQVHKRMNRDQRPTAARVGQLLAGFEYHGYLASQTGRSQGARRAKFYRLNETGAQKCGELGIGSKEKYFFQTSAEQRRNTLTKERLERRSLPAKRIIGFYAYRGGLGRTTMVAHVANGLAQRSRGRRILVIDMDFSAPELDRFFDHAGQVSEPGTSDSSPEADESPEADKDRGLRGLLLDFHREKSWKRPQWLADALGKERYFRTPLDGLPNLCYMSTGMSDSDSTLAATERARAMEYLRLEANDSLIGAHQDQPFFPTFKKALLHNFDLVLIDSQTGRSLSAFLLAQISDQLVTCLQHSDTSPDTLTTVRSILTTFFSQQAKESETERSAFFALALSAREKSSQAVLAEWIGRHIASDPLSPEDRKTFELYDCVALPWDSRIGTSTDWRKSTPFFDPIVKRLEGSLAVGADSTFIPPELRALMTALDPSADRHYRSICAGSLERIPAVDFARFVSWYLNEPSLHQGVDAQGIKYLEEIAEFQFRKLVERFKDLGKAGMD